MKFLRVWTCSRTHDRIYIKSEELKPLCPVCSGLMSKARGDGLPALLAQKREIEVEVFDEEKVDAEETQEEEPFDVFPPEKLQRITPEEPEQDGEEIQLTQKESFSKKRKEKKEVRL